MEIRCTIDGDPFGTGLENYSKKTVSKLKKVLKVSANEIKKEAISRAPSRTGKLKKSFTSNQENGGLTQIVGSRSFYLHLASDTYASHTIKPKKKKFLAWGGYVGKFEFQTLSGKNKGNWTAKRVYKNSYGQLTLNKKEASHQNFARQVQNPGHTGSQFFQNTLTDNRAEILNAMYRVLKEG